MKRLNTFQYISWALLLLLAACENDPRILPSDYYAVRFTNAGITLKESYTQTVRIEVHNAGPALDEDLVISYKVTGSAREGIDYTIVGDERTVTIPAGEYFGYIEVNLINNSNNILRTQDVVFALKRVDSDDRTVGQGQGGIGSTFTLNIQDDCILGGPYTGASGSFSVPTEGISITSADCKTYTVSNWNLGYFSPPYQYTLTFTDNDDNTITIEEQDSDAGKITGSGVVDPVTRKIKIVLTLLDIVDNNNVPVTINFTLTPDE